MFWGVSDHFDTARKSIQNWPNWCHYRTSSLNKVASENLATNAPDPLHWTPNSCFGVFQAISLLHESRCKTGRTRDIIAQVRYTKSRPNFSQRTHPIHSIGPKTQVLGCFGHFRCCTKVVAKLAELVPLSHKFAKQSCVRIFRNEHTQSTPLDPKLMFSGVSVRFVTARKLMQNLPNWCINAKVRKTKSPRNFSQRTHPIHSIGPKTHVLGRFGHFGTARKSLPNRPNWCHYRTSSLNNDASEFSQRTLLIHSFGPQKSCFRAFRTFSLVHESRCKKVDELAPLVHEVVSKFFTTNAPNPLHWTQNLCFGAFRTVSLLHESHCKTGQTGAIIAQVR
jgi:hypothetical protein